MEITACPNCGSKNIGIGTLGDGIISGLSSWKEVCRDCGYQGPSLVFDSESAYNAFLDALCKQKTQHQQQTADTREGHSGQGTYEHTTKQQEVQQSVPIKDSTSICPEKKRYLFEFIVAIVLTIVFFVIMVGSSYLRIDNRLFSQNDVGTLLSLFGSFVGIIIFFFLLIVLLETAYRSIIRQKK